MQKGNADAAVRQNQNDFENNLREAMAKVTAEAEANKANYANQANLADQQWYTNLLKGVSDNAATAAQNRYNTDWNNYLSEVNAENDMIAKGYRRDKSGKWVKTAGSSLSASDSLAISKAVVAQKNKYLEAGMDDAVASALARADYGVSIGNDDKIVSGYKAGYTGAELADYVNAGGGEAGTAAADAAVIKNAEKASASLNKTNIVGFGTFLSDAKKDGTLAANHVIENLNVSGMNELEANAAVAIAIGKVIGSTWAGNADIGKNETRIKSALTSAGVSVDEYYSLAMKYCNEYRQQALDNMKK